MKTRSQKSCSQLSSIIISLKFCFPSNVEQCECEDFTGLFVTRLNIKCNLWCEKTSQSATTPVVLCCLSVTWVHRDDWHSKHRCHKQNKDNNGFFTRSLLFFSYRQVSRLWHRRDGDDNAQLQTGTVDHSATRSSKQREKWKKQTTPRLLVCSSGCTWPCTTDLVHWFTKIHFITHRCLCLMPTWVRCM